MGKINIFHKPSSNSSSGLSPHFGAVFVEETAKQLKETHPCMHRACSFHRRTGYWECLVLADKRCQGCGSAHRQDLN